jgi:hypothetical protein
MMILLDTPKYIRPLEDGDIVYVRVVPPSKKDHLIYGIKIVVQP